MGRLGYSIEFRLTTLHIPGTGRSFSWAPLLSLSNLVLPFVLVRFGLRNRLAQLATTIFLLTIPLYSLTLGGMKITDYAIAATVLAALSYPPGGDR